MEAIGENAVVAQASGQAIETVAARTVGMKRGIKSADLNRLGKQAGGHFDHVQIHWLMQRRHRSEVAEPLKDGLIENDWFGKILPAMHDPVANCGNPPGKTVIGNGCEDHRQSITARHRTRAQIAAVVATVRRHDLQPGCLTEPRHASLQAQRQIGVNGETRQAGDLDQMIWNVAEIIATLSGFVALAGGDLIFTGTPAGVGPIRPGDRLRATLAGVTPLEIGFRS